MQFIPDGPDIPDQLVQAHEEGRVVFFCGAGISYPAGLPDFKELVRKIFKLAGTGRKEMEIPAFKQKQYDTVLNLLERRLRGGRHKLQQYLADALKPNLRKKGASATHAALLELARDRKGAIRLVTTNFDRIFEHIGKRSKRRHHSYAAPLLPIPKKSRWDGVVYLHGLLPERLDENELNRLVLTSGDFGLAYLTERWAARFASELFRNYIVCFVGYSISDPVMRYIMDALAADGKLGETILPAYVLAGYEAGAEKSETEHWKAKGVTPILYQTSDQGRDHSALHKTLKAWADTYRDGINGKESVVAQYASARPSGSTQQDDFVGRMLWALSDSTGIPAKRFAEFNPVPSLDWLEAFSEPRYRHDDLERFGVQPQNDRDENLHFSLTKRPTPYRLAPMMALAQTAPKEGNWDEVMSHIASWLTRHMDDPKLIVWLTTQKADLHPYLAEEFQRQLDKLSNLEREGDSTTLDKIRHYAPRAVPSPLMRALWRIVLNGYARPQSELQLFRWKTTFLLEGPTTSQRLMLRDLLSPRLILRKRYSIELTDDKEHDKPRLGNLLNWELTLASSYARTTIRDLSETAEWRSALPMFIGEFERLLHDALDLMRELGVVSDYDDRSYWHLPSISDHPQNEHLRDWVLLIELLRDAWLKTLEVDADRAKLIALQWFEIPYPTFKRLALFAASRDNCIDPSRWADWLVRDNSGWLWTIATKREVMRLLVLQGSKLSLESRTALEAAILHGPPREMYGTSLAPKDWQSLVNDSIWLRLSKLREGGAQLGRDASRQLDRLTNAYPERHLSENESEEFAVWTSGTGDPDFESMRQIDVAPSKRNELIEWLKQPEPEDSWFDQRDTWKDFCRRNLPRSLSALCALAREGTWPARRWGEALQAWSDEKQARRSWRYAARIVQDMPDRYMLKIMHSVSLWLQSASESIVHNDVIFLDLCNRIIELCQHSENDASDGPSGGMEPILDALNDPVGHVAQALMSLWFSRKPNDNDLLPNDIESILSKLCDTAVNRYRHGRVILASQVIALFRVDRHWAEKHLLPLFDWRNSEVEAKGAWEGFLWSPRIFHPLVIALKPQFLSTVEHFDKLGEHRDQFAAFLTYVALNPPKGISATEFRTALGKLSQAGLDEVARTLWRAMEGAGEQRAQFWKHRVKRFLRKIWPKNIQQGSERIAMHFALICIAADDQFPDAYDEIKHWLQPIGHTTLVIHRLLELGHCTKFPAQSLYLLSGILSNGVYLNADSLKKCLEQISSAAPELRSDSRYRELDILARMRSH